MRKQIALWQAYLHWRDLVELRKRHMLRAHSARHGSGFDAGYELEIIQRTGLDGLINAARKEMIDAAKEVPIWSWATGFKGLRDGCLAAQLIALVDDIERFGAVSKLWRYSGFAVIDGRRERVTRLGGAHYNPALKGVCYLIARQFIWQGTAPYAGVYAAEKARQRQLHPEEMCAECACAYEACRNPEGHRPLYTDLHLHHRAWGKAIKAFLKDMWLEWRGICGLPASVPYEEAR